MDLMPTPFEQAAALTSAAVDTIFGEVFTFVAMKPGADRNLPRIIDTSRPVFSAPGGFVGPSKTAFPHARGTANNQAQGHVVTEPFVSIDNVNLKWAAVTGDRVTQLKTGAQYEIARPMPDGVTRTIFILTAKTS
jgi:hypothetical protein